MSVMGEILGAARGPVNRWRHRDVGRDTGYVVREVRGVIVESFLFLVDLLTAHEPV